MLLYSIIISSLYEIICAMSKDFQSLGLLPSSEQLVLFFVRSGKSSQGASKRKINKT